MGFSCSEYEVIIERHGIRSKDIKIIMLWTVGNGRADIWLLLQSCNKSLRDGHKLIDHPIKMKNGDFTTTKQ